MGLRDQPLPQPDWDNPIPMDPRMLTPEQVELVNELRSLALMLPEWLTMAATIGTTPSDWRKLADVLDTLSESCAGHAVPGRPIVEAAGPGVPMIESADPDGR
jgi:hypothetical protein